MTQEQKDDVKCLFFFGFAFVAVSFLIGVFDGLDRAMAVQDYKNRLSVYCQQRGAMKTLCGELKD